MKDLQNMATTKPKDERPITPMYVRVCDSAKHFGFSQATAYRWASKGHIKMYKKGGMTLLKTAEVASYIESVGD